MSKLDHVRKTADKLLNNIEMTDSHKAAVHYRIAQNQSGYRGRRAWIAAGAGLAAAVLLIAVLATPLSGIFGKNNDCSGDKAISTEIGTADKDASPEEEGLTLNSGEFNITPLGGEVSTDSSFIVSTDGSMTAQQLSDCLSIEPAVGYSLNKEESGDFILTPEQEFESGTVITLSLDYNETRYAWAFQTETKLSVVSTTPGSDVKYVPVESGIEINFSSSVSSGAEEYISISPSVDGKFEYNKCTVIFIPTESLAYDTVYTVTVAGGIEGDSKDRLEEDYTFSFRTYEGDDYWSNYIYFSDSSITSSFIPGDGITLNVSAGGDIIDSDIKCDIYKLADEKEYLSLAESYYSAFNSVIGRCYDVVLPSEGLTLFASTTCNIIQNTQSYTKFIALPELDKGYYLAELTTQDGKILQKLIQVSAECVYTQSLGGELFVWVNSSETGTSVSGAVVSLGESNKAKTASDGTAVLSYDLSQSHARLYIKHGSDIYADYIDLNGIASNPQQYAATVYIDRAEYLPTDTVNYWGAIFTCNGASMPESLEVRLCADGEGRSVGTVMVSSDGIFSGELALVSAMSRGYTLEFVYGDEIIASKYFTVSEYTKPAYVLSVAFDKEYYRRGDSITAEISGTFFDGTPAPGLELYAYGSGYEGSLVLDENGIASITFSPETYGEGWDRRYVYLSVSTSGAEDESVCADAGIYIFPSDYMLTFDSSGDYGVEFTANAIDFEKYGQYKDEYESDYDLIRGKAAVLSGSITVMKNWYEKVETGKRYDYINKVNVPVYDYIYHEDPVYTEEFTTEDGKYSFDSFTPDGTEYAWYHIEVSYTTPDGVYLKETYFLSYSSGYPGYGSSYYFLNSEKNTLTVGETFSCELSKSGEIITDGRLLCTVVQDKVIDYGITENGKYSLKFTKELIPNALIYGAYFDGRHIFSLQPGYIAYDSSEKALDISITTDREVYAPGDEVTVSVDIGRSGDFVVSVVDEAAFAVREQDVDTLGDLYSAYYTIAPDMDVSYKSVDDVSYMAEGGGEGGSSSVRDDFLDTAAFISGKTDKNGKGEVTFTLPDNLTSWRITVAAVSGGEYAGHASKDISVSQDFFMNLVMNDTYAYGDELALSARVYGAENGSDVSYRVELDGKECASVVGKTGEFTFFNLGKRECGSYDVTVYASCGGYSDAVRRTVSVKASRMEFTQSIRGDLEDGIDIDASRSPVTVIFHAGSDEVSAAVSARLLSAHGGRIDQSFAQKYAYDLIVSEDEDAGGFFNITSPASYQAYSGGMMLTRYSSEDAVTTAYALVTMPEYMDTGSAKTYLQNIIFSQDSSEIEVSAAYMGLAALREPVLNDVRLLVQKLTDDEAKYYAACALALLGDGGNARTMYEKLFRITSTDAYSFVDAGENELDYELTARAAMLSVLMGRGDSGELIKYLLYENSEKYLANFQLMAYLRYAPKAETSASFSCVYDGKKQSFDLSEEHVKVLEFNKDELDSADFKVLSGQISYAAIYTGGLDEFTENAGNLINISCAVPDSCKVGDCVDITVNVSFENGCPGSIYSVDIALPSGLRYVSCDRSWDSAYYFTGEEDGRVSLTLCRYDWENDSLLSSISFTVKARAVLPGKYTFEPCVCEGCDSGLVRIGAYSSVTITE